MKATHILTFDIEDWFHTHQNRRHFSGHSWSKMPSRVEANTGRILDWLDQHDQKATFFVLGWEAEQHPELIREILTRGHELGAHSHWHHHANRLRPEDFRKDLRRCIDTLQDLGGKAVTMHRAPGYSLRLTDQWAFDILVAEGITTDSSVTVRHQGQQLPLTIQTPAGALLEFPLLQTSMGISYTGGGFFRNLPGWSLPWLFKHDDPYRMYYFHPRDFDPEVPSANLFSPFRNGLNGRGTFGCMKKLESVMVWKDTFPLGVVVEGLRDFFDFETKRLRD